MPRASRVRESPSPREHRSGRAGQPIDHGMVVVAFAATPTKRLEDMRVGPHAALQVTIEGRLEVSAVDLDRLMMYFP
jgi:hypothetical protein